MYLNGSKWSVGKKSRRRSNPWRIIVLVALIGAALYFNQVVVPTVPPLFMPTYTPTRSPESFIVDAEQLASEGKTVLSVQAYREAIKANPKNASVYLAAAKLLIQTKEYQEALQMTENALLLNPNNSTAHALRGHILGYMGEYAKAQDSIAMALEKDPNNGVAQAYLAIILILYNDASGRTEVGLMDRAIEASRQALALNGAAVESHFARGLVLEYTQNHAEALQEFMQAVNMEPNNAEYHMALGRVYNNVQQPDKAIEEFNKANTLNPADPDPDTYISRTYFGQGEFTKAFQYGEQAAKDDPADPYMHGNLGLVLFRMRDYEQALLQLTLAIKGGLTEEGVTVQGLPIDRGRISEYYSNYGLSLARLNMCNEALQVSRLINDSIPDEVIAVANAEAIVEICAENARVTPTPKIIEATTTPVGPTPVPTETTAP